MTQRDDPRVGEVLGELAQIPRISSVPGIDRLVGVTDNTEVWLRTNPSLEEPKLQWVYVLELVNKKMAMAPVNDRCVFRICLDVADRQRQEVVEVDDSLVSFLFGITFGRLNNVGDSDWRFAIKPVDFVRVPLEREISCGDPFEFVQRVQDHRCVGPAAKQLGDHRKLAVKHVGRADALLSPPLAQLGIRQRVERAGRDVVAQPQTAESSAKLDRRLASECDRQGSLGVDRSGGNSMRDSAGEYASFAAASAGEDGKRVMGRRHCRELGRVEAIEESVGVQR